MTTLQTPDHHPNTVGSGAIKQKTLALDHLSTRELTALCGQFNRHLRQIEQRLSVKLVQRGHQLTITSGQNTALLQTMDIINRLISDSRTGVDITPDHVHLTIQQSRHQPTGDTPPMDASAATCNDGFHLEEEKNTLIRTKKLSIKPMAGNQRSYVRSILTHDINFGIGAAGTGKTYLAAACAVQALINDEVERILLVRPAVEAGEKLGFLPGDLSQKVDPYLRPLFDALYEMMGFDVVDKLIERNIIEIAPLAYMRGRTLNNAFIILDESQNTTPEQMKMFLTRIGFGSTAVINGDPSQVDLPRGQHSGLRHACDVLSNVQGISFTRFNSQDVVRHPLIQHIVDAYDAFAVASE